MNRFCSACGNAMVLADSGTFATVSGFAFKRARTGVWSFDAGKIVTITYPNTNTGAGDQK